MVGILVTFGHQEKRESLLRFLVQFIDHFETTEPDLLELRYNRHRATLNAVKKHSALSIITTLHLIRCLTQYCFRFGNTNAVANELVSHFITKLAELCSYQPPPPYNSNATGSEGTPNAGPGSALSSSSPRNMNGDAAWVEQKHQQPAMNVRGAGPATSSPISPSAEPNSSPQPTPSRPASPAQAVYEYLAGFTADGEGLYLLWAIEILTRHVRTRFVYHFGLLFLFIEC
jgi:hypothetical protein